MAVAEETWRRLNVQASPAQLALYVCVWGRSGGLLPPRPPPCAASRRPACRLTWRGPGGTLLPEHAHCVVPAPPAATPPLTRARPAFRCPWTWPMPS